MERGIVLLLSMIHRVIEPESKREFSSWTGRWDKPSTPYEVPCRGLVFPYLLGSDRWHYTGVGHPGKGKDIRQHLKDLSDSAMSRIFKRLRFHGIIERMPERYKYFTIAYRKEVIVAGLAVKNLVLIPALA